MNFIKTIYNKVKQSYDDYWAEYDIALQGIPPEQREYVDDLTHYNFIRFNTKNLL